jgi:integrase
MFHVEVRLKGSRPERASFRTRSHAKKWIQDTESAIRDGRYSKVSEVKRHDVKEMIDRFIEQWLPRYPQRQAKQTALLGWWKKSCGHILLSDLTPATIAQCRDHLLNENTVRGGKRSPSTVNRYLSAFGKVLSIAVLEWGWIENSPIKRVAKPAEAPGRERFLSHEETDRLLAACAESLNKNLYPMVAISLLTGMRYGELTNL